MTKDDFLSMIKESDEYAAIRDFYGDRCAERSKVPLINHIDEGIVIIFEFAKHEQTAEWLALAMISSRAYCLHPLYQNDSELTNVGWAHARDYGKPLPILLAMEYRARANEWLSDKVHRGPFCTSIANGRPNPGPLAEVRLMLIADKVQNYKDFLIHHKDTHERSDQLDYYFQTWLEELGVSIETFNNLCEATK